MTVYDDVQEELSGSSSEPASQPLKPINLVHSDDDEIVVPKTQAGSLASMDTNGLKRVFQIKLSIANHGIRVCRAIR